MVTRGDSTEAVTDLERLLVAVNILPVGLVQCRADGTVTLANAEASRLLMPLLREAAIDNLYTVLGGLMPDLAQRVRAFAPDHGRVCDGVRLAVNLAVQAVGAPRWLSLTLQRIDTDRLVAVIADATQQVEREQQLRRSEAWFNAALTGINDHAALRLDAQGRIDGWHPSVERLTGHAREALLGQPYSLFYPEGSISPERLIDRLHEADHDGWSLDEGWCRRAGGAPFWGSFMIVPMQPPVGVGSAAADAEGLDDEPVADVVAYSLVIRDISNQREAHERRRLASAVDHLTGIANRRAFDTAAEVELARWRRAPRPLSLILFDTDHFKRINDTHGHPAGDAVLRHLAARIAAVFRPLDVVARLGGEEFAVLLPSTGLDDALAAAERVRRAVEAEPVVVDGVPIPVTLSGGVSAMNPDTPDIDALMKRADQALYAAKGAGRNRVEASGA